MSTTTRLLLLLFQACLTRLRLLGVLLLPGLLAGCGMASDNHFLLLNCDFEQFEGWARPLPAFLTAEKAHSGHYSMLVAGNAEFSEAYRTTFEGYPSVPSKLRLQGWTFLPDKPLGNTMLVVTVNCHGRRPNVWNRLMVNEVVTRYEQWEHLTKTIYLPTDLQPTDEVSVYVWCPPGPPGVRYFDDLTLEGWR